MNPSILLINPVPGRHWKYIKNNPNLGCPINILSIGSFLKLKGYEVNIVDAAMEKGFLDRTLQIIRNREPLFVGLTVMSTQIPSAIEISENIKKFIPNLNIVWGGIHPTLYPKQTLSDRSLDIIVRGLGEQPALEIAEALLKGKSLSTIKNIGYKSNNQLCLNHILFNPIHLEDLPFLNYDLIDVEKYVERDYSELGGRKTRTLMVYAGIGCPYKCSFCINSSMYQRKYMFKSATRLLDEVELLINKYQIEHINFRDENFFTNKNRIVELLDQIEKRGLKFTWNANARADYFNDTYFSESILKRLRSSGCILLGIGAESGDEKVLNLIDKEITLSDILNSARTSKKYGIRIGYSFMSGIPGEKIENMLNTIKFINQLKIISNKNYIIGPQLFRPYPGSKLYHSCIEYGLKEPESLRDYSLFRYYESYPASKAEIKSRFPWIENASYVFMVNFFARLAFMFKHQRISLREFLKRILSAIALLRIKTNFFYFPIEYKMFLFIVKNTDYKK